ncbi:MAG: invasion associated locus B family protein, partial [Pseudomonadota bacterium]
MLTGFVFAMIFPGSGTPVSAQWTNWFTSPGDAPASEQQQRATTPVPAQQQRAPAPAPERKPATQGAAPKAKQVPAQAAQPAAPQAAAPAPRPDWNIQCQNAAGAGGFNCQMSRAVVLKQNGKLLLRVTVTLPAKTKKPTLLVQTPFGLFLPAGLRVQIDEKKPQAMVLQTCNQNGCFASGPLSGQMLAGMKKGKQLKAIFQNLQKKD